MPNLITQDVATEVVLTASAGQTVFSFPFAIFDAGDLRVTVNGVLTAPASVSGVGSASGGSVTLAAQTAGARVVLQRVVPIKRVVDLPDTGPYSSADIDRELDRAFAILQEASTRLGRSVRVPVGDTLSELPSAASRASSLVGFSSDGKSFLLTTTSSLTETARAAGQLAAESTALVVTGAPGQSVSTLGLLAGISAPVNGQIAYLTQKGREGWFQFSTADHSANVTADTYQGIYVAPSSATTGASGAWVRFVFNGVYHASWFGVGAANNLTNSERLHSLEAVRTSGSTVILPPETISVNAASRECGWLLLKPGRVVGYGCTWKPSHDENRFPLAILTKDVEVVGLRFEDFKTTVNGDSKACITATAHPSITTVGVVIENIRVVDCVFRNISNAVRSSSVPFDEAGTTVVYIPRRIWIERCRIEKCDYQPIILSMNESYVSHNYIEMDSSLAPRGQDVYALRLVGTKNFHFHDNHVVGRTDRFPINVEVNGFPGPAPAVSQTMEAENIYIFNNRIEAPGLVRITQFIGEVVIDGNTVDHPLTTTAAGTILCELIGGGPERQGECFIRNNRGRGINNILICASLALKTLHVENNHCIGNSATGVAGDAVMAKVAQGGDGAGQVDNFKFINNTLIAQPDLYSQPLQLVNITAGSFVLDGNIMPEANATAYATLATPTMTGGFVMTDKGQGFKPHTDLATLTSTNNRHPAGVYAAVIANIAASPRPNGTEY